MKEFLSFYIENWRAFAYFLVGTGGAFILEHYIEGFNPLIPIVVFSSISGMMIGRAIERMED